MKTLSLKSRLILFPSVLMIFFFATSCRQNEIYFEYKELKNADWRINDTLFFDLDSINSNGSHLVYIEVTNNVNYPYQNLWLFVEDNLSDSIFSEHKLECRLADEAGNWVGSGFGSLYQSSFLYKTNVQFAPNRKDYQLKIVHGMRDDQLSGIERIGVKVVKEESRFDAEN